jgi:CutA1 divalent ion tolerance protein
MTDQICEVIVTADNPEWLLDFTRSLVRDRLAACGQHVLSIRSIYRWHGAIEDEGEVRVALHPAELGAGDRRAHDPGTLLRRARRDRPPGRRRERCIHRLGAGRDDRPRAGPLVAPMPVQGVCGVQLLRDIGFHSALSKLRHHVVQLGVVKPQDTVAPIADISAKPAMHVAVVPYQVPARKSP